MWSAVGPVMLIATAIQGVPTDRCSVDVAEASSAKLPVEVALCVFASELRTSPKFTSGTICFADSDSQPADSGRSRACKISPRITKIINFERDLKIHWQGSLTSSPTSHEILNSDVLRVSSTNFTGNTGAFLLNSPLVGDRYRAKIGAIGMNVSVRLEMALPYPRGDIMLEIESEAGSGRLRRGFVIEPFNLTWHKTRTVNVRTCPGDAGAGVPQCGDYSYIKFNSNATRPFDVRDPKVLLLDSELDRITFEDPEYLHVPIDGHETSRESLNTGHMEKSVSSGESRKFSPRRVRSKESFITSEAKSNADLHHKSQTQKKKPAKVKLSERRKLFWFRIIVSIVKSFVLFISFFTLNDINLNGLLDDDVVIELLHEDNQRFLRCFRVFLFA